MMRCILLIVMCVAGLEASAVPAGADVQSALQAKYDAMSRAFAKKDASYFDRVMSPSYFLIGTDGSKTNRSTILSDLKHQMSTMTDATWIRTVPKPTVKGSTATATVKGHFKGSVEMQGKKQIFELVSSSKDVWSKKGPDWILIKSQVLSLAATLNGRPVRRG